jgi:hypothetical protein
MPKKLDRCVEKLKKQGNVKNPYAICQSSLKKGNKKRKKK